MMKATAISNYDQVMFYQHEMHKHILVIVQYEDCGYMNGVEIGRFNFLESDGYILTPDNKKKEYKRFNAILNTIFKYDSMFGYSFKIIEDCKKAAQTIKKAEKQELITANKEAQTKKAYDYIQSLKDGNETLINVIQESLSTLSEEKLIKVIKNNFKNAIDKKVVNEVLSVIKSVINGNIKVNDNNQQEQTTPENEITTAEQTTNSNYIVGNRTFQTYAEAVTYCLQSDFDPELMIITEQIKEAEKPLSTQESTEQPTTYQLYKHSFTTYNDAYNYACKNRINLTMILPSTYPMIYERLIELNKLFTFSKYRMNLDELKEYYNFISSCPVSLDQEDIYYSLVSLIKRKEDSINRQQEEKQRLQRLCKEVENMLISLHDHGVTTKENKYTTSYYYNDELLYSWSSGITIEKQHQELTKVYNNFMNSLQTA